MQKISIKREQSQAGLSFAERENRRSLAGGESNFRPQVKNKLLLLLALLLTAATGAMAQTETLLTTITASVEEQVSYSTANVATVSFSTTAQGQLSFTADWGWRGYGWSATVTAAKGYTITKCVFYDDQNRTATDSEAPFVVETTEQDRTPRVNGTPIDGGNTPSKGVKKIEVYGYAPPTYSITLAEGTEDADNWTISPAEAAEGAEVTATYSGDRKVKSVKAVKKVAPNPGLLSGVFSVSSTKKVNFSKGNLSYASSKWSFFDNQYDYYASYSADAWDHFGWSTSATTYGMNTSTDNSDYSGNFVDWGSNSDLQTALGTGWFTLTSAEWEYLFNTRSAATVGGTDNGRYAKAKVNDVQGLILFPDTYTHPDGVTAPANVNTTGASFDSNTYTVADWTKMESAGCVFLPAASSRNGSTVNNPGSYGYYWSATPDSEVAALNVFVGPTFMTPVSKNSRKIGFSVRLVKEVAAQ